MNISLQIRASPENLVEVCRYPVWCRALFTVDFTNGDDFHINSPDAIPASIYESKDGLFMRRIHMWMGPTTDPPTYMVGCYDRHGHVVLTLIIPDSSAKPGLLRFDIDNVGYTIETDTGCVFCTRNRSWDITQDMKYLMNRMGVHTINRPDEFSWAALAAIKNGSIPDNQWTPQTYKALPLAAANWESKKGGLDMAYKPNTKKLQKPYLDPRVPTKKVQMEGMEFDVPVKWNIFVVEGGVYMVRTASHVFTLVAVLQNSAITINGNWMALLELQARKLNALAESYRLAGHVIKADQQDNHKDTPAIDPKHIFG